MAMTVGKRHLPKQCCLVCGVMLCLSRPQLHYCDLDGDEYEEGKF